MGSEPKPKAPSKAKRRRKPPEEFVDYIIWIESWDWSYSLSLNTDRRAVDPYHEFRHLQISGRLLHPKGLKTDRVEITLLPSYDLLPSAGKKRQPRCVGSLDVHDDRIAGLVSIPMDALPPILQMLMKGHFRIVEMRGARFRYHQALCNSFRLEMKLDKDDLPVGVELPR
ncbi:hypothetical protein [Tardiphaga robiniae]|uniref:Uncharacterized protein n=1 Tax=Tardiphaga robiniae TaxID=943830 RepID=A0A7G6U312_9BRAD|nr:hypothetical protein [Tardiphaga robiniae]QND73394.1 hypothetical protein HB776_20925 [Tardiphaga robiniae]